jgi:hypothetical protein
MEGYFMPQLNDICSNCGRPFSDHYGNKCPHPSGAKKANTNHQKFTPKEKKKD